MNIFLFTILLSLALIAYRAIDIGLLAFGLKESVFIAFLGVLMTIGGMFFAPWLFMLMINKWLIYSGISYVMGYWSTFILNIILTVMVRQVSANVEE